MDRCGEPRAGPRSLWEQFLPWALQSPLKPQDRGKENIQLTGFDFLDGADIQIRQFSQLFLSEFFRHAFPSHAGTELCEFGIL